MLDGIEQRDGRDLVFGSGKGGYSGWLEGQGADGRACEAKDALDASRPAPHRPDRSQDPWRRPHVAEPPEEALDLWAAPPDGHSCPGREMLPISA